MDAMSANQLVFLVFAAATFHSALMADQHGVQAPFQASDKPASVFIGVHRRSGFRYSG